MGVLGDLERNVDALSGGGLLRFVTAGSVDDGKSTLIGRLLHDSRAILDDQLQAIERASRRRGVPGIDLSLLTDGLEAEREQGITIDVAYRYFASAKRKFIIADSPGHEQYTRNMVTAASNADAAVILLDARKGVLPQTRRHACIVDLLGIRHVLVAVNKMDLVGDERAVFEAVREQFLAFARPLGIEDLSFFPISALRGDNVVDRSDRMRWYGGPSLLEALESIEIEEAAASAPMRFAVQLVSRPLPGGGTRAYLGRLSSGRVAPGDEVVVLPSGQSARLTAVVAAGSEVDHAVAGDSVGLVLDREIDVSRGDMIASAAAAPAASRSVQAALCWLSAQPLAGTARLLLKHTTRTVRARVTRIAHRLDLESVTHRPGASDIAMNDIATVEIALQQPVFCDRYAADRHTGAFILIDEHSNETVAAGLVL